MNLTPKKVLTHLGLATFLAILTYALTALSIVLVPNIGWGFLIVAYISIGLGQIVFYYWTTYTNFGWTILNFILNFILWVAEQVNLESAFHDTLFYQSDNFKIGVTILGGLLWGINKLLLDQLFILLKIKFRLTNRLDNIIARQTNLTRGH